MSIDGCGQCCRVKAPRKDIRNPCKFTIIQLNQNIIN